MPVGLEFFPGLKNMDDIMLHRNMLKQVRKKLENFLSFCREKNLKLKPSKLNKSEQVKLGGGAVISSETVKNEHLWYAYFLKVTHTGVFPAKKAI